MLTRLQKRDSNRCEELQDQGEDMDCLGCSCSVCIAQEPTENREDIIKQFTSYAQREGVIDTDISDKLIKFAKHYIDSIDS